MQMKILDTFKIVWRKIRWLLLIQAIGVALSVLCAGCRSSGYFGNRSRDAADIFTATVGFGAGTKVRVGPFQIGVLYNIDTYGLRGGQWGQTIWYETLTRDATIPYPIRTQPYQPKLYPWEYPKRCFGQERWQVVDDSGKNAFVRCKSYEAVSPIPFVSLSSSPAYYTQIDFVLAAIGSLRLGFNPGELLDFFLGWTTLDIYGDDLDESEIERVGSPI